MNPRPSARVGRLAWLVLFAALIAGVPALRAEVLIVSVEPRYTTVDLGQRWSPLLAWLERETGLLFQLRLQSRQEQFERDVQAGIPDLVFLDPVQMTRAAQASGYVPLVRTVRPLHAVLVVAAGSEVRKVADLAGKTLALPAHGAATVLLDALPGAGAMQPVYVGTHQNVFRHVLLGEASAGGGVDTSLALEPDALRQRLRVLHVSPPIAGHPLAAHPRVSRAVRQRLVDALTRAVGERNARDLLLAVELAEAVPADYQRDYAALESRTASSIAAVAEK